MKTIKSTTKKGQNLLAKAVNNEGITLDDVYGKASWQKELAWRECFYKCHAENGHNFHICSHNTFQFSVAWEVENGMRMETAQSSYLILFPEYC